MLMQCVRHAGQLGGVRVKWSVEVSINLHNAAVRRQCVGYFVRESSLSRPTLDDQNNRERTGGIGTARKVGGSYVSLEDALPARRLQLKRRPRSNVGARVTHAYC
jgi:hypothetical protein